MTRKDLKDFIVIMASFSFETVVEFWLKPSPWSRPEKNERALMAFLVEMIIATFIGACRAKDIIGLNCDSPVCDVRNPSSYGNLCSFKRSKIEDIHVLIVFMFIAIKSHKCNENQKKIFEVLFRRGFNQAPPTCIVCDEVTRVLKEVHSKDCGKQQEGSRLLKQLIHLGYYWPTTKADATSFARRCKHVNLAITEFMLLWLNLHSLFTHWLFHTWVFDLIGPINPLLRPYLDHNWKRTLYKMGGGSSFETSQWSWCSQFHLTMSYDILASLTTWFMIITFHSSIPMCENCYKNLVDHLKSSTYYLKGNGYANATNKTMLLIFSRMVYEEPKRQIYFLYFVLWAYCTSKPTSVNLHL